MLAHWIWLATREGLGDRGRALLLERFRDAEDVYFAEAGAYAAVQSLSAEAVDALQDKALDGAMEILDACRRADIRILTIQDAAYPQRLKNIPDPPVVLYYRGTLPELDALPLIAVVGTRKASAYGLTAAKRMGYQIAACGGVVVSGIADGIDAMAMRGALTAGTPVVGVLGNGADVVYPLNNRALYADVEKLGCLLTEFPPGTPPMGRNFPRRNRIISGLCCGVLVVEAPGKSGALITAQQAAEQGRDVFVVPGNIDVESCRGSNALLRDGAIAVSCGWDVVSEYETLFPGRIRKDTSPARQTAQAEPTAEAPLLKVAQEPERPVPKKRLLQKRKTAADTPPPKPTPGLSDEEEKLVSLLRQNVTLVDDMMAQSGLPAGQVLAMLTVLEIKGIIRRLPGKRVELK